MADREKAIKELQRMADVINQYDDMLSVDNVDSWVILDTLALVKEQKSTLNRLRSTMEDMVRGNATEEVSYLLRLLNKWEQGEVYASDSV